MTLLIPSKAHLKFYLQDWHAHPRRDLGLLTVLDFQQLFACAATEIEMTALDLRFLLFLLHNLGKRHLLKFFYQLFWLKFFTDFNLNIGNFTLDEVVIRLSQYLYSCVWITAIAEKLSKRIWSISQETRRHDKLADFY